jgi:hypothetical protein
LKPGQSTIERQYFDQATQEKPDGKTVLSNYARFKSNYEEHHNENVQRGGYVVPAKSQNNMSKFISALIFDFV